jgi:hypothetical protein
MAQISPPETLLDTVAAAQQLDVSPSFLAKARMQGTGPRYRKLDRAVRYAQGDLDHWLLACSRTSTAEQPAVMPPSRKPPSR